MGEMSESGQKRTKKKKIPSKSGALFKKNETEQNQ